MNAAELCKTAMEVAVGQYESEGEITMKVVLHAPTFVLFAWPSTPDAVPDGDFPEWAHRVIGVLGGIGGVEAAAIVAEAWYTVMPHTGEEPHLEPGELGRRAGGGDASVATALVVSAADGAKTVTEVSVPHLADDGTVTWTTSAGAEMVGRIPRLVTEAFAYAQQATPAEGRKPIAPHDLGEYAKALRRMAPALGADVSLVGLAGAPVPQ